MIEEILMRFWKEYKYFIDQTEVFYGTTSQLYLKIKIHVFYPEITSLIYLYILIFGYWSQYFMIICEHYR